jgi:cytoskeletal protein CcmA (bactofilin family)
MLFGKNLRADQPVNSKDKHPAPKLMERSPLTAKPTNAKPASKEENGNVLIVGDGIRLKGEITACDRLVVEGHVEVSLNETHAVEFKPKGRFIGSCEVEEAEISGVYEGDLTVRGPLTLRRN